MIRSLSVITPCFRAQSYLPTFFNAFASQTVSPAPELVLVHNQPSRDELRLVGDFVKRYRGDVRHVVVDETNAVQLDNRPGEWALETVAQSMNRAIEFASGDCLALWNVDDVRTPHSLEAELAVLDANPDIAMTYGDIVSVCRPGDTVGTRVTSPEFSQAEFMRSCHGAFQMWRRDLHEVVGLFDEQLRSGADFDLWVRVAASRPMKKTHGLLGYYLNAGLGLSTRKGGLQPLERTVIELRYGILDKLDYRYVRSAASQYRVGELHFEGSWHPVSEFVADYEARMADAERLRPLGLRRYRVQRIEEAASACLLWARRATRAAVRSGRRGTVGGAGR